MSLRARVIALMLVGGMVGAVVAGVLFFGVRHLSDHQSAAVPGLVGAAGGTFAFLFGTWRLLASRLRPPRP